MGGEEKLKAVQNIVQFEENENGNSKSIIAVGKLAVFSNFKGKSSKMVFDGSYGYNLYDGEITFFNESQISTYKKSRPFSIVFDLKERKDLKLGEIETIGTKDYYTIIQPPEVLNGKTFNRKYYFDKDNGLCLGIVTLYADNSISYFFNFDYKKITEVLLPFTRINTYQSGTYASFRRSPIAQIKVNEPISDSVFE